MDDTLADFNPATSHMFICRKEDASEYDCNRDCASRLYDLAARQERLLNPTSTEWSTYPECEGHNETQHRDCAVPWCSRCGWFRGRSEVKPMKVGQSSAERIGDGKHLPWTPEGGYGS